MWIVQHLPDWVFHTLFFLSLTATLLGFFLGQVKYIKQYTLLLKLSGIIGLVLAILLEGAMLDNKIWQERVKEVEAKLAKAEEESKKTNQQLAKVSAKKVEKQKQKTIVVKQYITREVTKYDNTCVIPKEFVKAVNDAAEKAK
jgi:hypothetical protein